MKTTGIMTTVLTEGVLKVHLNGVFFFFNNFLKNGKFVLFFTRKTEKKKTKKLVKFSKIFFKKNEF